jgi:uncharacterized protein with PQ loop repeat
MSDDYLMNTASIFFFICYLPEFYANYVNKNANVYNVFEKIVMLTGSTFGLSYAIKINSSALLFNYIPLICLDTIALCMRSYYAYKNRNRDVRVIKNENYLERDIENPIHDIENQMYDIEL